MDDSDLSFDLPEACEVPERSFLRSEIRPEDDFADAVLKGFARRPRSLPCRFFYDARGSELFEEITKLEEYYPTRVETALLEAYGVEIVLTPAERVMEGAMEAARDIVRERGAFMPGQFDNPENPAAHRAHTAQEILEAMTGLSIDAFVAAVGTGGTISGVGEVLRAELPGALPPGPEQLVESAERAPRRAPHRHAGTDALHAGLVGHAAGEERPSARVGGDKAGAAVVGRRPHGAEHHPDVRVPPERRHDRLEPAGLYLAVVVGERDQVAPRGRYAGVTGRRCSPRFSSPS